MKDHLTQIVLAEPVERRRNLAREYVQIYLLRQLHELGAQGQLAFVGGTALRLLYRLPRFSEDLDFSADMDGVDTTLECESLFKRLKVAAVRAGYEVNVKARLDRTVASAFFRFEKIPQELGWTSDPRLALSVKIEVDLDPPAGAAVETTLIQRFFPIALRHHDLPSLFAGKLHAVLTRPWAKGRDWFDLVWYLTEKRGLEPNLKLLDCALAQTGHDQLHSARWREEVLERLHALEWDEVVRDLRPFVERQSDIDQLTPARIEALL